MKTVKINVFILARRAHPLEMGSSEYEFVASTDDLSGLRLGHIRVGKTEFEYEIPSTFSNPQIELEGISEQIVAAHKRYLDLVSRLETSRAHLLAGGMPPGGFKSEPYPTNQ